MPDGVNERRENLLSFGLGLLGATGSTPEEAERNRLVEIERRILAIEERLTTPNPASPGGDTL